MISAEYLRSRLHYCVETGAFTWKAQPAISGEKKRWNSRFAGKAAGHGDTRGHLQITLDSRFYAAHRQAWLWVTGQWPANDIDHKDRVKTHNWFSNLREATRSQNNMNVPLRRDNKSGIAGVRWEASKNKWQAFIAANSKQKHLGFFVEKQDAIAARLNAAAVMHGEFAPELTEAIAA